MEIRKLDIRQRIDKTGETRKRLHIYEKEQGCTKLYGKGHKQIKKNEDYRKVKNWGRNEKKGM